MATPLPWSPAQDADILAKHKAGMSNTDIALGMNRNRRNIYRRLQLLLADKGESAAQVGNRQCGRPPDDALTATLKSLRNQAQDPDRAARIAARRAENDRRVQAAHEARMAQQETPLNWARVMSRHVSRGTRA